MGRRQIIFVGILVAKVLPTPPLCLGGLHSVVLNHGPLKTYGDKLLTNQSFQLREAEWTSMDTGYTVPQFR